MRSLNRLLPFILVLAIAVSSAGCGSLAHQSLQTATPVFRPDQFFEGPVRSWGVTERRSGEPVSRFRTEVNGVRDGEALIVTQHFFFEGRRRQERVWRIRRIDEHRYEASANDVVGLAVGEAYGNTFRWDYTLAARPGNPLFNVRMKHWMYLQADGTVVNRVQVTKFGVILRQVTEFFRRGTEAVADAGDGGR